MTEDYLIQEFHEAGIYLPNEREEIELLLSHKSIITQQEMMINYQRWRVVSPVPGIGSILGAIGKVAGGAISGFLPR